MTERLVGLNQQVLETIDKDPDAELDYGFDWTDWLQTDETIQTSTWTVPDGLTYVSKQETGTETKVWIKGGTPRKKYILTNKIETNQGRIDNRSLKIAVIER
jgi:hypothetical protein